MTIYPSHNWNFKERKHLPYGHFKQDENMKQFLDELGKKLQIRSLEDWHDVSATELEMIGAYPY